MGFEDTCGQEEQAGSIRVEEEAEQVVALGAGWVVLDGGVALRRPTITTVRGVPSFICFSIIAIASVSVLIPCSDSTSCDSHENFGI